MLCGSSAAYTHQNTRQPPTSQTASEKAQVESVGYLGGVLDDLWSRSLRSSEVDAEMSADAECLSG